MQRYFSSPPLLSLPKFPKFQSLPTITKMHLPIPVFAFSLIGLQTIIANCRPVSDVSTDLHNDYCVATDVNLMDAPTNITTSEADAQAEPAAAFIAKNPENMTMAVDDRSARLVE
jgi:hypothetical protein